MATLASSRGKNWYWCQNYADREYDEDSIMHYDSLVDKWQHDEVMYTRLALCHLRGPDFVPPKQFTKNDLELCYSNFNPSGEDIEGLKKLYAWSNPN